MSSDANEASCPDLLRDAFTYLWQLQGVFKVFKFPVSGKYSYLSRWFTEPRRPLDLLWFRSRQCIDPNGKQLIFLVKPGSDSTLLWKATVRVACVRVDPQTRHIEACKFLNLKQFMAVFKTFQSHLQTLMKCEQQRVRTEVQTHLLFKMELINCRSFNCLNRHHHLQFRYSPVNYCRMFGTIAHGLVAIVRLSVQPISGWVVPPLAMEILRQFWETNAPFV